MGALQLPEEVEVLPTPEKLETAIQMNDKDPAVAWM